MAANIKNKDSVNTDDFAWLIAFLKKYGIVLAIVVSVVFTVAVGYAIVTQIKMNQNEKAAEIYDTAIGTIESLRYVTNEQARVQYYNQQLKNLEMLTVSYPKTVPAVRARLFLGKNYYMDGLQNQASLKKALSYYKDAVHVAPNGFYKSLSLVGLGLCYEQQNDFKQALSTYREVADRYVKSGFVPVALAGMGRSYEMMNQVNEALTIYRRLIKEYPDSRWTDLARGKLYYYSDPNSPARNQGSGIQSGSSTNASVQLLGQ